jgi:hypothetical protein
MPEPCFGFHVKEKYLIVLPYYERIANTLGHNKHTLQRHGQVLAGLAT